MKPKLEIITLDDVRSWRPCDPVESFTFVPPDWSGTVFDILDCEQLSAADRIWLVVREEVMELRDIRLFALRCAKRVEHLMEDQRSKDGLEVVARFLDGKGTQEELESARDAANTAARAAAWAAAWAAAVARAAARSAVEATERAAQIQILKEILTEDGFGAGKETDETET